MQIAVRNVVTNVNTQAFPASIYGRLDSVGFTQLMASADNLPEPLRDEIFRIAITWWGSRPDKAPYDIESLGHVPSRVDSSKVHVLCVRPFGSKQPIRAVVTVPLTAYRHFGCNPFTFAQAGFFGFLKAFLREPNSLGVCESAIGPASSLTRVPPGSAPLDDRVLAAAIDPLLGAKPRLIACSEASHELRDLIEAIVAAMPVELRSKTAIFSFAYASDATVQAATPVLAGIFDKSAPPLPSIETFGPPTSEALTAVLRARHDPTGETLRDSPQDDLGNSVRELRRRVEELEQQGLAAAVDSAPATPRPVTSPPEQHACPQEPEAGSSEKGKEKQPAIRPVVVSRPSIGLLLALAAASVLTAVALCAAFFFHYLGIEHPLQGATEAEQLVPRLRMLERRVGGPSSADDSLFRQIQQLENDLGRPEDPTTLFGRVSLLRNQLGDEGRSGLALAVGHLETAFKTLNSELLDLQSKLGTGDAPPSESLRARQTKMKTALGEMELGLNRLSTELMDFEQNKLGSGTVPAEGSLRAKQVQIGTTLGKLDSVLGGLGAELSNFEKNMIGIGDTPLRGSLRARQMQLNDTSMTVATLDRLEKTLGTLNHQLAEFDRNKIGNEEKPPAGSLRARQKQLNDTSMTMATLDRLEKTLGTLNQQLAEFERNKIGSEEKPPAGSLRARQKQLNDTSKTEATLDRLESALQMLNQQLSEFEHDKIGSEEKPATGSLRARQKQLNDTSKTEATLDRLEKTLGTLNKQLAEFEKDKIGSGDPPADGSLTRQLHLEETLRSLASTTGELSARLDLYRPLVKLTETKGSAVDNDNNLFVRWWAEGKSTRVTFQRAKHLENGESDDLTIELAPNESLAKISGRASLVLAPPKSIDQPVLMFRLNVSVVTPEMKRLPISLTGALARDSVRNADDAAAPVFLRVFGLFNRSEEPAEPPKGAAKP